MYSLSAVGKMYFTTLKVHNIQSEEIEIELLHGSLTLDEMRHLSINNLKSDKESLLSARLSPSRW